MTFEEVIEINAVFIFTKRERIKADAKTLAEIAKYAAGRLTMYRLMMEECRRVMDEFRAKIDKMPVHTEEEMSRVRNICDVIPLQLDNEYHWEAVNQWAGMSHLSNELSKRMDHWRKINVQATRALSTRR